MQITRENQEFSPNNGDVNCSCILFFKIAALPSHFHFVGSGERVSCAKRKLVSSYLGKLYLAPKILNPYLNFNKCPAETSELFPLAPNRIYVQIIHYVQIFPLAQNLDLHGSCTLRKNCPAVAKFFHWHFRVFSFWRQLVST